MTGKTFLLDITLVLARNIMDVWPFVETLCSYFSNQVFESKSWKTRHLIHHKNCFQKDECTLEQLFNFQCQ